MLFVTPVSEQKGEVALPGHFTLLVLLYFPKPPLIYLVQKLRLCCSFICERVFHGKHPNAAIKISQVYLIARIQGFDLQNSLIKLWQI